MAKPATRNYSRYSLEALALLGAALRVARIQRKIATRELAERAGISRDLLHRIEKGDPRCEIGVVFELAAILQIPLFEPELEGLQACRRELQARLMLLPRAIHGTGDEVKDDF